MTTTPTETHAADVRKTIPSLDGIRAIAILLVLVGHSTMIHMTFGSKPVIALYHLPFAGVTAFFVISGFLITRILTAQLSSTGRIAVGSFYLRRAKRLWPALWVYIAVVVTLGAVDLINVPWQTVVSALFFVTNYMPTTDSAVLGHTWSLSVEEQFYLLWPLLVLLFGRKRLGLGLVVAVLAAPVIRVASYFLIPALRETSQHQFHTRYDAIAFGCLLAVAWNHRAVRRRIEHPGPWGIIALVALLAVWAGDIVVGAPFMMTVGYSIQGAALAYLIALAVQHHDSLAGRILNHRIMVSVGLMSYSLYLWQQLLLLSSFRLFAFTPLALVASFGVAALSYRYLEKPFMRRRASRRQVTSHRA